VPSTVTQGRGDSYRLLPAQLIQVGQASLRKTIVLQEDLRLTLGARVEQTLPVGVSATAA